MQRECVICNDEYPITAFIRVDSEEELEGYTPDEWKAATVSKVAEGTVFTIGGDRYDMSPFCTDCGRMIGISRKRMEERLGSGPIKTRRKSDGKYVDLESYQEYMYIVNESDPEWEFALEDEVDSKGRPVSFTDVDLARLSYWRIKRVLADKGFNEIPWHEVEDHAQNVSLNFLEKMRCINCDTLCYMQEDSECDDYEPADSITYLHSYHWACCKGEAKAMMQEWVDRRKAEIPEDVLNVAAAMNMTDDELVRNWRTGAVEVIDKHVRESPMWTRLVVEDLAIEFGERGVDMSARDIKVLRNALLAAAGESKDGKNKAKVKRIIDRLEPKMVPEVYAVLKDRLNV